MQGCKIPIPTKRACPAEKEGENKRRRRQSFDVEKLEIIPGWAQAPPGSCCQQAAAVGVEQKSAQRQHPAINSKLAAALYMD